LRETGSSARSGEARGIALDRLHSGGVGGEFDEPVVEGEVELQGEGGPSTACKQALWINSVGGGGGEEAGEGSVVAGVEAVVAGFVGRAVGGGEGGLSTSLKTGVGAAEAGEGLRPPPVIPAKAGISSRKGAERVSRRSRPSPG
jgi:hypothetical protein